MERIYYSLWYRLDNKDRYLIWFTRNIHTASSEVEGDNSEGDNSDGVVHDSGIVPIFITPELALLYAQRHGFTPLQTEQEKVFNLDVIAKWLKMKKRRRGREVNWVEFLNAWNLFADLSLSIGADFDPNKSCTRKIYAKLFWENNLPSMIPAGKIYVPVWPARELDIMHEILSQGLSMFRSHARRF
jgi:hypothetical protein